jgi:hypothetical protein
MFDSGETVRTHAVIVASALVFVAATGELAAQVKNYETPGNLESTHDVGCVGPARLQSKYTPPDLYRALGRCLQQDKYREAAFLFALAGVYGRYDTQRVADQTAHQAVAVLRMETFGALSKDKEDAFKKTLQESLGSPGGLAAACREITRIGPPDYYPRYMIEHGMGEFLKDGLSDGLVAGFDPPAAWKRSLDTFLHCPGL